MISSSGAAITALAGRVIFSFATVHSTEEYRIVLPPVPTGATNLNSLLLHCDLKGRPYRIEDFRQKLKRTAVLSDIVSLGAYQMNRVWLAILRTPEAKERLVNLRELTIKSLRCVVIDPYSTKVRLRGYWVPFHAPDEAVSKLLEPYGKVAEVSRENWRVDGFQAIESTTRIVRMTLKSGVTPNGTPHQLRLQGEATSLS